MSVVILATVFTQIAQAVILLLHTGFIDFYAFPAVLRYSAYMARIYNERHSADLKNLHLYWAGKRYFQQNF